MLFLLCYFVNILEGRGEVFRKGGEEGRGEGDRRREEGGERQRGEGNK